MKRILILIILSQTIHYTFGQACGIYRIKYVGKINSELLKIEKISVPTIEFLHGFEEEKGFVEIIPIKNEIDVELGSHLTSQLYDKSESLLKFYKTKRESIPVIIIVVENGKTKEIRTELTWNNIQIKKLEDDKFGNLFELNLNEIDVDNSNLEKKYPWDNIVTKVAINAIHLSINNFVNEIKDENFPSSPGPFNVPFQQKKLLNLK